MRVEDLIRELAQYPEYWEVEISIDVERSSGKTRTERGPVRDITDHQVTRSGVLGGSTTPVVVIRS